MRKKTILTVGAAFLGLAIGYSAMAAVGVLPTPFAAVAAADGDEETTEPTEKVLPYVYDLKLTSTTPAEGATIEDMNGISSISFVFAQHSIGNVSNANLDLMRNMDCTEPVVLKKDGETLKSFLPNDAAWSWNYNYNRQMTLNFGELKEVGSYEVVVPQGFFEDEVYKAPESGSDAEAGSGGVSDDTAKHANVAFSVKFNIVHVISYSTFPASGNTGAMMADIMRPYITYNEDVELELLDEEAEPKGRLNRFFNGANSAKGTYSMRVSPSMPNTIQLVLDEDAPALLATTGKTAQYYTITVPAGCFTINGVPNTEIKITPLGAQVMSPSEVSVRFSSIPSTAEEMMNVTIQTVTENSYTLGGLTTGQLKSTGGSVVAQYTPSMSEDGKVITWTVKEATDPTSAIGNPHLWMTGDYYFEVPSNTYAVGTAKYANVIALNKEGQVLHIQANDNFPFVSSTLNTLDKSINPENYIGIDPEVGVCHVKVNYSNSVALNANDPSKKAYVYKDGEVIAEIPNTRTVNTGHVFFCSPSTKTAMFTTYGKGVYLFLKEVPEYAKYNDVRNDLYVKESGKYKIVIEEGFFMSKDSSYPNAVNNRTEIEFSIGGDDIIEDYTVTPTLSTSTIDADKQEVIWSNPLESLKTVAITFPEGSVVSKAGTSDIVLHKASYPEKDMATFSITTEGNVAYLTLDETFGTPDTDKPYFVAIPAGYFNVELDGKTSINGAMELNFYIPNAGKGTLTPAPAGEDEDQLACDLVTVKYNGNGARFSFDAQSKVYLYNYDDVMGEDGEYNFAGATAVATYTGYGDGSNAVTLTSNAVYDLPRQGKYVIYAPATGGIRYTGDTKQSDDYVFGPYELINPNRMVVSGGNPLISGTQPAMENLDVQFPNATMSELNTALKPVVTYQESYVKVEGGMSGTEYKDPVDITTLGYEVKWQLDEGVMAIAEGDEEGEGEGELPTTSVQAGGYHITIEPAFQGKGKVNFVLPEGLINLDGYPSYAKTQTFNVGKVYTKPCDIEGGHPGISPNPAEKQMSFSAVTLGYGREYKVSGERKTVTLNLQRLAEPEAEIKFYFNGEEKFSFNALNDLKCMYGNPEDELQEMMLANEVMFIYSASGAKEVGEYKISVPQGLFQLSDYTYTDAFEATYTVAAPTKFECDPKQGTVESLKTINITFPDYDTVEAIDSDLVCTRFDAETNPRAKVTATGEDNVVTITFAAEQTEKDKYRMTIPYGMLTLVKDGVKDVNTVIELDYTVGLVADMPTLSLEGEVASMPMLQNLTLTMPEGKVLGAWYIGSASMSNLNGIRVFESDAEIKTNNSLGSYHSATVATKGKQSIDLTLQMVSGKKLVVGKEYKLVVAKNALPYIDAATVNDEEPVTGKYADDIVLAEFTYIPALGDVVKNTFPGTEVIKAEQLEKGDDGMWTYTVSDYHFDVNKESYDAAVGIMVNGEPASIIYANNADGALEWTRMEAPAEGDDTGFMGGGSELVLRFPGLELESGDVEVVFTPTFFTYDGKAVYEQYSDKHLYEAPKVIDFSYELTPADGSTVESFFKTITLKFTGDELYDYDGPCATLVSADGSISKSLYFPTRISGENAVSLNFGDLYTEWADGEYTLTINPNMFAVGTEEEGVYNFPAEPIVVKYTLAQPDPIYLKDHIALHLPESEEANKTNTYSPYGSYGFGMVGYGLDTKNVTINRSGDARWINLYFEGESIASVNPADVDACMIQNFGSADDDVEPNEFEAQNYLYMMFDPTLYNGEGAQPEFFQNGKYTVEIPDYALMLNGRGLKGMSFEYNYKHEDNIDFSYELTPSYDSPVKVEELKKITVTFNGAEDDMYLTYSGSGAATLTDPEGNVQKASYPTRAGNSMTWDFSRKAEWPISGTYTFNVPEGAVWVGIRIDMVDDEEPGNFPGLTAIYTAEAGNTDGVVLVGVDAADSYTVYTIDGKAVKLDAAPAEMLDLEPGLYIINGKKAYVRK